METVSDFVQALRDAPSTLFNPWAQHNEDDLDQLSPQLRRANLKLHLTLDDQPRVIIVGEAPGYRGCRMSGVPFTSERQILAGSVPRVHAERISTMAQGWTEPSATVVWRLLYMLGLAEQSLCWNACPWHPPGAEGPLTNRAPSSIELLAGRTFLRSLHAIYPDAPFVAVGEIAATQLRNVGIKPLGAVRHPAFGGATLFGEQMRTLLMHSVPA